MIKRLFDIVFSLIFLCLLAPFFILISLMIIVDSRGGVFYRQLRVGQCSKEFYLLKFRSMKMNAETLGLLTVGFRDPRITRIGYFLRKFKLDELPQLINVLIGQMSVVGPRPEVRKYVDLYTSEQKKVLSVKPGITDYASLEYFNENELLAKSENPESTYVNQIMPDKLRLNKIYLEKRSFFGDCKIIVKTIVRIFS